MSNARDWYARHLGGGQSTAPPREYAGHPRNVYTQPQAPAPQIPPGYTVAYLPNGQAVLVPIQQNIQGAPVAPFPNQPVDTRQIQVTKDNIADVMGLWQGGEGVRTETDRCPKCGGDHYFSRRSTFKKGPPPSPICMDCGYNELFDQGDQATWQAAAGGPAA